jgi:hypothetical protein
MSGSLREGLWSLIRRVLRRPSARHGIEDFVPQEDLSPSAPDIEAPANTDTPAVASPPELTSVQTAPPAATAAGLASIRLIFTDGSVVPLPEGSLEGRKAQYLARRVLETGKGS